jgi:hypothetical protein
MLALASPCYFRDIFAHVWRRGAVQDTAGRKDAFLAMLVRA